MDRDCRPRAHGSDIEAADVPAGARRSLRLLANPDLPPRLRPVAFERDSLPSLVRAFQAVAKRGRLEGSGWPAPFVHHLVYFALQTADSTPLTAINGAKSTPATYPCSARAGQMCCCTPPSRPRPRRWLWGSVGGLLRRAGTLIPLGRVGNLGPSWSPRGSPAGSVRASTGRSLDGRIAGCGLRRGTLQCAALSSL